MKDRRKFLKLAATAVLPAGSVVISNDIARADDGSGKEFLGSWNSIHTLPFPPGQFREFLSFADGGVLHETNAFLHAARRMSGKSLTFEI